MLTAEFWFVIIEFWKLWLFLCSIKPTKWFRKGMLQPLKVNVLHKDNAFGKRVKPFLLLFYVILSVSCFGHNHFASENSRAKYFGTSSETAISLLQNRTWYLLHPNNFKKCGGMAWVSTFFNSNEKTRHFARIHSICYAIFVLVYCM